MFHISLFIILETGLIGCLFNQVRQPWTYLFVETAANHYLYCVFPHWKMSVINVWITLNHINSCHLIGIYLISWMTSNYINSLSTGRPIVVIFDHVVHNILSCLFTRVSLAGTVLYTVIINLLINGYPAKSLNCSPVYKNKLGS